MSRCRQCGYDSGFDAAICPECGFGGGGAGAPAVSGGDTTATAGGRTADARPTVAAPRPDATVLGGDATNAIPGSAGRACFFVKAGPDQGKQYRLGDEEVLGRGRGCSIVLRDTRVSGAHGHLRYVRGRYIYSDLQATNHSFLIVRGAERRLRAAHTLTDGDELRVGATVLKFIEFEGGGR